MASETEISNMALALVGGASITSYAADDSERAALCRLFYPQARDEALMVIQPNFAIKRVTMALSDVTPAWEYTYAYTLPSDFLVMLDGAAEADEIDYRIEETYLLTDSTDDELRYVARITTAGSFSPLFTQALVYNLASYLCFPIRKAREHAAELKQMFMATAYAASNRDSQQGGSGNRPYHTTSFDTVRRSQ